MAQKQLGVITAYGEWLAQGNTGTKTDFLNSLKGSKGDNGVGVPVGGSVGQVLKKKSTTDFDTEWKDEEGGVSEVNAQMVTVDTTLSVTTAVGGYKVGDKIQPTDNLLDVVKKLVNPVVPPTYLAPTLTLAGSDPKEVEIGSNISPILTPTWNQRDAGSIYQYRLSKNGGVIQTVNNSTGNFTDTQFQLISNTTYQAAVDYAAGVIKNDSEGNPDPNGRIQAGTTSSGVVSYVPRRKAFFGILADTTIPDSSNFIRDLSQSLVNPVVGSVMSVAIPNGAMGCCFAYPASLKAPASIISQSSNIDVKDGMTEITVSVEGANGYTAENYRVIYIIADFPFGGNGDTYTLTI